MRLPYPIQKTVDLLLAELQHIGSEIGRLRSDIKKYSEAKADADKAQEAKEAPQQEILATVDLPHGVETHKSKSDKTEESGHQNKVLLVSVLTLIGVAIYAGVAILQWQEMIGATGAAQQAVREARLNRQQSERALNSTIEQFRQEQRAWVGATYVSSIVIKAGEMPTFQVEVVNTGKTPALHVRFTTSGTSRPAGEKIKFVYPGPANGPQINSNVVLQPTGRYYLGVGGKPPAQPVTDHQVDVIKSGENWFWVYGKIVYDDTAARTHHTKFCFIIASDLKNSQPCGTYNEAD
jgi:hypothetical protein